MLSIPCKERKQTCCDIGCDNYETNLPEANHTFADQEILYWATDSDQDIQGNLLSDQGMGLRHDGLNSAPLPSHQIHENGNAPVHQIQQNDILSEEKRKNVILNSI